MILKTNKSGFTLIELVMVIVILAILAVVAIPKYQDMSGNADQAAEDGIVGAVRAGIYASFAAQNPPAYPATLDGQLDGTCATCFDTVLDQGGVSNAAWSKAGLVYTGPTGTTYTYVPATGIFN